MPVATAVVVPRILLFRSCRLRDHEVDTDSEWLAYPEQGQCMKPREYRRTDRAVDSTWSTHGGEPFGSYLIAEGCICKGPWLTGVSIRSPM